MNCDGNMHAKFGIRIDKQPNGWWGFGVGISHIEEETYLHVNFFRWFVAIGVLYENEAWDFVDEF